MPDLWWKSGIVYEIYPRSFQDSDGDGIGDLNGIRQRLDYLVWLGVDVLWVSPIYPSPMADFGYDVADYCSVDPRFGTIADFEGLVAEAHARGLKVILDFVPSHTSSQHPWFIESRSSRSSAKRDWYIWADAGPDGAPPNNWISNFGGPAWTFDEPTGQYYLHGFLREQPDLNWRNPAVRQAMYAAMRFWLDKGVDGFRVDVMWLMIKDAALRDNPPNPGYKAGEREISRLLDTYTADQPEVQAVVAEMRAVLDAYPARVLIGEIYLPVERLVAYYGKALDGAQLPFNFHLIQVPWTAAAIGELIVDYEGALPEGAWPNWVLGNHDQPRVAARVGSSQARVAAMLLLTLRGTPTLYYGDELGLARVPVPPEAVQDPWEKNEPGLGLGRDPSRTPMQWDASANAGFTTGRPWLPVDPAYATVNVAVLKNDAASLLTLHRSLIALRRQYPALSGGSIRLLSAGPDILGYERREGDARIAVFLNLGVTDEPLPGADQPRDGQVLLSTHADRTGPFSPGSLLRANEGIIFQIGR